MQQIGQRSAYLREPELESIVLQAFGNYETTKEREFRIGAQQRGEIARIRRPLAISCSRLATWRALRSGRSFDERILSSSAVSLASARSRHAAVSTSTSAARDHMRCSLRTVPR